jgi:ABC-type phosphate transport system permease subunit
MLLEKVLRAGHCNKVCISLYVAILSVVMLYLSIYLSIYLIYLAGEAQYRKHSDNEVTVLAPCPTV